MRNSSFGYTDTNKITNYDFKKLKREIILELRKDPKSMTSEEWELIYKKLESSINSEISKYNQTKSESELTDFTWKKIIRVVEANTNKSLLERFQKITVDDLTPALLKKLAKLTSNANAKYIDSSILKAKISVPVSKDDWNRIENSINAKMHVSEKLVKSNIIKDFKKMIRDNIPKQENFITDDEWEKIVHLISSNKAHNSVNEQLAKYKNEMMESIPSVEHIIEHIQPNIKALISELIPNTIIPLVNNFLNTLIHSEIAKEQRKLNENSKEEITNFVDHYISDRLGDTALNVEAVEEEARIEVDYDKIEKFIDSKIKQPIENNIKLDDEWKPLNANSVPSYTIIHGRCYFKGAIQLVDEKNKSENIGNILNTSHHPDYDVIISVLKNQRECRLSISSEGNLSISTQAKWVSFDGVSFTL